KLKPHRLQAGVEAGPHALGEDFAPGVVFELVNQSQPLQGLLNFRRQNGLGSKSLQILKTIRHWILVIKADHEQSLKKVKIKHVLIEALLHVLILKRLELIKWISGIISSSRNFGQCHFTDKAHIPIAGFPPDLRAEDLSQLAL